MKTLNRNKLNRICHLTSVHPFYDTRILVKECRSLSAKGFNTHLIAPNTVNHKVDGISVHGIKSARSGRISRMTRTVWQVYKTARAIDAEVYHFHDPELIPVGILLKLRGKKVFYDVHEDVPRQILSKTWIPMLLRWPIARLVEIIENLASGYFDGLVVATPFIAERFHEKNQATVNVNNFPILSELTIENVEWKNKERAVCYIGGIGGIRGIFEMIEAIGKVDANLLLGGQFSEGGERQKAIKMPGWSSVVELGQLNRLEVKKTLSRSMAGLVVLHPIVNYIYALPVKMFEYMCAGIPVIASNFPLWREIVEGNQCGICVDPMNPQDIAMAIQWIVDHPVEAQIMGENGKKAVYEKYNWGIEEKKLISMYENLLILD